LGGKSSTFSNAVRNDSRESGYRSHRNERPWVNAMTPTAEVAQGYGETSCGCAGASQKYSIDMLMRNTVRRSVECCLLRQRSPVG